MARLPADGSMRYARALIRSASDDDGGALEDIGHISIANRTEGMADMARRAVIRQMLAQAQMPDLGGHTSSLLQSAEKRAGDNGLTSVGGVCLESLGPACTGLAVLIVWYNAAQRSPRLCNSSMPNG